MYFFFVTQYILGVWVKKKKKLFFFSLRFQLHISISLLLRVLWARASGWKAQPRWTGEYEIEFVTDDYEHLDCCRSAKVFCCLIPLLQFSFRDPDQIKKGFFFWEVQEQYRWVGFIGQLKTEAPPICFNTLFNATLTIGGQYILK